MNELKFFYFTAKEMHIHFQHISFSKSKNHFLRGVVSICDAASSPNFPSMDFQVFKI